MSEKLNSFVDTLEPGIKLMMPILVFLLTIISTMVFGKLNDIDGSMTVLTGQIKEMTKRIEHNDKRISYLEWEMKRKLGDGGGEG